MQKNQFLKAKNSLLELEKDYIDDTEKTNLVVVCYE